MMNALVISFRFIFSNIWKIILTLILVIVFIVVLFPLSDLNDAISAQVSKLTNNTVYVEFEKMHINPFSTSVSLEKLYVEAPQISNLSSEQIEVSPSISDLIFKQKPGGHIKASGFLKGEVDITLHPVKSTGGADKSKLELNAQNISLKEMRDSISLSLPIKGQLNLTSQAIADLTFTDQPDADINLTILKFEMASTFVPLQDFGQIALPELKFGKIELKGKLAGGKFTIESGKLGTSKDDLYGDIKGDISLTLQREGQQIKPFIGGYNISVDLKANPAFKDKAKLFLSFLDGYKTDTGSISNYKLNIKTDNMMLPPQMTPIR